MLIMPFNWEEHSNNNVDIFLIPLFATCNLILKNFHGTFVMIVIISTYLTAASMSYVINGSWVHFNIYLYSLTCICGSCANLWVMSTITKYLYIWYISTVTSKTIPIPDPNLVCKVHWILEFHLDMMKTIIALANGYNLRNESYDSVQRW